MRCVRSIEGHVELEKMKALMPGDVHPSHFKLLHKLFYLRTVGCSAYTDSRPTSNVLRIRHNALDVLHVGTRAVYGLRHAHERLLAEVLGAGNFYQYTQKMNQMGDDTGGGSTYYCRHASPIAGRQMAVAVAVVVAGVQTFHRRIGIAHLQARIDMRE
jgi:hypothetical protein